VVVAVAILCEGWWYVKCFNLKVKVFYNLCTFNSNNKLEELSVYLNAGGAGPL
jgi:hypothetical protein